MDEQQISQLKAHYSGMSDEELADLLVTRGNSLTDEANFALKIILKKRNINVLQNEINEKYEFYAEEHNLIVLKEQQANQTKKENRRLFYKICFFGMLVGVLIMIFDDIDAGLKFSGVWIMALVFIEFEIMKSSVISSIFRSRK
jgi:hypothetical protein